MRLQAVDGSRWRHWSHISALGDYRTESSPHHNAWLMCQGPLDILLRNSFTGSLSRRMEIVCRVRQQAQPSYWDEFLYARDTLVHPPFVNVQYQIGCFSARPGRIKFPDPNSEQDSRWTTKARHLNRLAPGNGMREASGSQAAQRSNEMAWSAT